MKAFYGIGSLVVLALTLVALIARFATTPPPLYEALQNEYRAQRITILEQLLSQERQRTAVNLTQLDAELEQHERETIEREAEQAKLRKELSKLAARRRAAEARQLDFEAQVDRLRQQLQDRPSEELTSQLEDIQQKIRRARMEVESVRELEAISERDQHHLQAAWLEAQEQRAKLLETEMRLVADLTVWRKQKSETREILVSNYPRALPSEASLKAPRRDRCMSCHLGLVGGESSPDAPPVFRQHPRLDLFLSTDSPHPMENFGCTVCHAGEGLALDFATAGHHPRDETQAAQWKEQGWTWKESPHSPIRAGELTQASCASCHGSEPPSGAANLWRGNQRLSSLGCHGCHDLGPPLEPRSVPLDHLASKTQQIWAYQWIAAPRSFDNFTLMPHLFDLAMEQDAAYQQEEIRAIVSWLWQRSRSMKFVSTAMGDVTEGEALFNSLGCLACHYRGAAPKSPSFGPNLFGLGSKVTRDWLVTWLLNPRVYHQDARMPSLRLTTREAADLAAFLLDSRLPQALPPLPEVDARTRDALVLAHLEQETTLEESQARLAKMGDEARDLYLGERSFARYGCAGCHSGENLPQALRLSPSERSFFELEHPRVAFSWQRSASEYLEERPRPHYALNKEDRHLLQIALASRYVPRFKPASISARNLALTRGRNLVARHGCTQCHQIEDLPAKNSVPSPAVDLNGYGQRVRPSWLLAYLRDPGDQPLRSWQKLRMPTHALSLDERRDLVAYFAALSNVSLLVEERPFTRLDATVGSVVYNMLQCSTCHLENRPGAPPPYDRARDRLRPAWVVAWILDPRAFAPETTMPTTLANEARQDADSFLSRAIGAPMYWQERSRLERFFDSEQAMIEYLSDAERLAEALRAHLWTLEPGDSR